MFLSPVHERLPQAPAALGPRPSVFNNPLPDRLRFLQATQPSQPSRPAREPVRRKRERYAPPTGDAPGGTSHLDKKPKTEPALDLEDMLDAQIW